MINLYAMKKNKQKRNLLGDTRKVIMYFPAMNYKSINEGRAMNEYV